jgi:hypothetical protein
MACGMEVPLFLGGRTCVQYSQSPLLLLLGFK